LALLVKRGEVKKLPAILAKIAKLDATEKGEKQVTVRSATKLSPQQVTQCEALAREIFEAKTVVMTETIDETRLGGVCLATDDAQWDMTVRRRLRDLSRVLIQ
jgi:F0F1-type ATP synthase delta subunit